MTNHRITPVFVIPGVRNGKHLKEKLRLAIEERRDAKGVVERDYEKQLLIPRSISPRVDVGVAGFYGLH